MRWLFRVPLILGVALLAAILAVILWANFGPGPAPPNLTPPGPATQPVDPG